MKIRKWIRILHRDTGYIAFGLTLVYAISGIAVNHVDEWNPNYVIKTTKSKINTSDINSSQPDSVIIKFILNQLNETQKVKSSFRPEKNLIQIFLDGKTIKANFLTGEIESEIVTNRTVFREINFLHLNHPKKLWTYVADIFAVALAFLAITGLFMIEGKKGITGRGKWFTAIGILLPILFLIFYL
jgi:hypothetical protein